MTFGELLIMRPSRPYPITIHGSIIRFSRKPLLISHPAHIGTGITEDHSIRLQFSDMVPDPWPVVISLAIHLSIFIGTAVISCTSIGSVKPYLKNIAVLSEHLDRKSTRLNSSH